MTTLPLSPLTHEELNHRAAEAVTTAGHRAITLGKFGTYSPAAADLFAECAVDFDLYNGAAMVRVNADLGRAA